METVADIMTTDVVTLLAEDNVHQARLLLKKFNIRHLPIVDVDGQFAGMLTQRDLLNSAFNIVEKYGVNKLAHKEEQLKIAEVMSREVKTLPTSTSLIEAGEYFLAHKHACLAIVDNGKLQGIVTSVDFVKLSIRLLKGR